MFLFLFLFFRRKPKYKLTIFTEPFAVNDETTLHQIEIAVSSWLVASPKVCVHFLHPFCLNETSYCMGKMENELITSLTNAFGKDRFKIGAAVKKKRHIESINELFEAAEAESESDLVCYINNDIILPPNYFEYIEKAEEYFGDCKNWSLHIPRFNLNENVRKNISMKKVLSSSWADDLSYLVDKYKSAEAMQGYDFFMWNKEVIKFKDTRFPEMFIGRPDFEYIFTDAIREKCWFVTTYPSMTSYHMNHPERKVYAKLKDHPDSVYNLILSSHLGVFKEFNRNWPIAMNLTHIRIGKGKDAKYYDLNRKHNFPFT